MFGYAIFPILLSLAHYSDGINGHKITIAMMMPTGHTRQYSSIIAYKHMEKCTSVHLQQHIETTSHYTIVCKVCTTQ